MAAVAGANAALSPGHPAPSTVAVEPVHQRRVIIRPEEPIDDETLWNGPSRMENDGRSSSYHIRYRSSDLGEGSCGPSLLGRLFRLAVGAGAAVAVALAAKAAAPHVAVHGQAALAQLQANLTAQLRERSAAAATARQRRAAQRQGKEERRVGESRSNTTSAAAAAPSPVPAISCAPNAPTVPKPQPAGKQPGSANPQASGAATQLQIADMPPWLEGKAARPADLPGGPAARKLHGNGSGSKKLPPGAAAAAAKRSAELADLPVRPAPSVHVSMG